jgi:hypothetical protein
LSFTVSVPDRLPPEAGANTTEIVQLAPAASAPPQPEVALKELAFVPPISGVPEIVSVEAPVFVNFAAIAAPCFPITVEGKKMDEGASVAVVAPPPTNSTMLLPAAVSSRIVSLAAREPGADGVKITPTVQLLPVYRGNPTRQLVVFGSTTKSVVFPDVKPKCAKSSVLFPTFETRTVCAEDFVPTAKTPKLISPVSPNARTSARSVESVIPVA